MILAWDVPPQAPRSEETPATQARRELECRYGLALQAITDREIASAVTGSQKEMASGLGQVVDRLPIDESSFFRHPPLWEWLEQSVLPGLLDRAMETGRPARILSLGCAAGQEVYSVAMLAHQLLQARGVMSAMAWKFVQVKGVDASPQRVAQARAGVFNAWSVQRAPESRVRDYLLPDASAPGTFRVQPLLRPFCTFEEGNVLEFASGESPLDGYDLVLCQHVFIYFREEVAARALRGLASATDPEALLVVAPVEAHLLEGLPLERLPFVGAARLGRRGAPTAGAAAHVPTPRRPALRAARPRALTPSLPTRDDDRAQRLERYLRSALEHSSRGRLTEALQSARAACSVEPGDLMALLVTGQVLLRTDPVEGRRVLAQLLERASGLEQDAPVPLADELTVAQLSRAARLLLDRKEG